MLYAVVDTNIIVSALLIRSKQTNPNIILDAIMNKKIVPIIHKNIIAEYNAVLHRKKFPFTEKEIKSLLDEIMEIGINVEPFRTNETMIDEKDRIFYEVALAAKNQNIKTYLITGNTKHFPKSDFVVSPNEFVEIFSNGKTK